MTFFRLWMSLVWPRTISVEVGAIKDDTRWRQSLVFFCVPSVWMRPTVLSGDSNSYCAVKSLSNAQIVHRTRVQAWPRSAPWVGAMSEVVALELNLIFDLVDQYLRQKDANQLPGIRREIIRRLWQGMCVLLHVMLTYLWYSECHGNSSEQKHVTMDPVHQFVNTAIGVDVRCSISVP